MVFKEFFLKDLSYSLGGKGNANLHQAFYGIIHHQNQDKKKSGIWLKSYG